MGLKRQSRYAMAACLLGANAPDIDVFAPMILPVDGISFHRGPIHSVFAWPILAAGIVAILWLLDRLRTPPPGTIPFRAGDRKSTRLNSSHPSNSYAVFCLKNKSSEYLQPPIIHK